MFLAQMTSDIDPWHVLLSGGQQSSAHTPFAANAHRVTEGISSQTDEERVYA